MIFALLGCIPVDDAVPDGPVARFETTMGSFAIGTFVTQMPDTTENFLTYVEDGFYDGMDGTEATVFHRIVPGFVVQGGGFTAAGELKTTRPPIPNRSGASPRNLRGRVAMARTYELDSATSQFYVNLVDNRALDARRENDGYAVFGEIIEGLDVIDAMAGVDLDGELPIEPIVVLTASIDP